MKRKIKLISGIIAITLIFALSAISCDFSDGLPPLTGSVSIPAFIQAGDTVTVDTSSLKGTGNIIYIWEFGAERTGQFSAISGATTDGFTAIEALQGKFIRATVTREGFGGSISSNAVQVRPITALQPVVNFVYINYLANSVTRGSSIWAEAYVYGNFLDGEAGDKDVIWSLSGSSALSGTAITLIHSDNNNNEIRLTIGLKETATSLVLTATSVYDSTQFDTLTISVIAPQGNLMIITDIPERFNGNNGSAVILSDYDFDNPGAGLVATGNGVVTNGTLIVTLGSWKDSGEFLILLMLEDELFGEAFAYTNSEPFSINNVSQYKYDFKYAETNIAFNSFSSLLTETYKISISGLEKYVDGKALLYVAEPGDKEPNPIAVGMAEVTNDTVTFSLFDYVIAESTSIPFAWNKSGDYIIMLIIGNSSIEDAYIYTDGQSFADLGLIDLEEDIGKIPLFNISGNSSSLNINSFANIKNLLGGVGLTNITSPSLMPSF